MIKNQWIKASAGIPVALIMAGGHAMAQEAREFWGPNMLAAAAATTSDGVVDNNRKNELLATYGRGQVDEVLNSGDGCATATLATLSNGAWATYTAQLCKVDDPSHARGYNIMMVGDLITKPGLP